MILGGLFIAMGLAVATLAMASLIRHDRVRHGPSSRRFCRRLGLSGAERRLLERVARASGAPGAGSLLVSRGHFDTAAGLFAGDARSLSAIRTNVFD